MSDEAPAHPDFEYDAFISYRHREPDKSWVRETLVPRLEGAGLRVCVDYRCFRLGAPVIREMERAVEESCYTVAASPEPWRWPGGPASTTF